MMWINIKSCYKHWEIVALVWKASKVYQKQYVVVVLGLNTCQVWGKCVYVCLKCFKIWRIRKSFSKLMWVRGELHIETETVFVHLLWRIWDIINKPLRSPFEQPLRLNTQLKLRKRWCRPIWWDRVENIFFFSWKRSIKHLTITLEIKFWLFDP